MIERPFERKSMRPQLLRLPVVLMSVTFVALGTAALLVPDIASALYGVDATTHSARAFVRAAGARDIAIGGILLGLLARHVESRTVGITVLATTLVPIVDAVIVFQASGVRPATVLHAGSILPMLILAIALIGARD